MTQSRSQRKKSGSKRQPAAARRKAVATAAKPVVVPPLDPYVDREAFKPLAGRPDEPIKQTGSWRLWPQSVLLWAENKYTATTLLILPISFLALDFAFTKNATLGSNQNIIGALILLPLSVWVLINIPAVFYLQTRAIHGELPTPWQCYRNAFRLLPRMIGLFFVFITMLIGGLLLLIVPGIFVFQRYALSVYYMIDLNVGVREAMERSAADSQPFALSIWSILLVYAVMISFGGFVLAHIFPPFGGLFSTALIGLYIFAPALRYREVGLRLPASGAIKD